VGTWDRRLDDEAKPELTPRFWPEQASLGISRKRAGMSTEPEPVLAPKHARPGHAKDDPIMMIVDGQDFRIRERAEKPGEYDFDWLSGPHDYGFGITRADGSAMTLPEMEEAIRNFLAEIDPATGYLKE
jgi:hypothetical protein